ncbi:hypothetical protein [Nocardioides stalactiti]|uniref:hypothetical protein n=1 Tax=Nocardioides stalactiti TaxID=2755356 RepID=UPI0015FFC7B3|nr:hypothetical protein [Nocardioides stalactiti]
MDEEVADTTKLHAQTLEAWKAVQDPASIEFQPVTVTQIANRGPFESVRLISEYLLATQGDDWVVKRDGDTGELFVLAPQPAGE